MNYRQLTRKLRRLGWEIYRQAAGSHEIWCILKAVNVRSSAIMVKQTYLLVPYERLQEM